MLLRGTMGGPIEDLLARASAAANAARPAPNPGTGGGGVVQLFQGQAANAAHGITSSPAGQPAPWLARSTPAPTAPSPVDATAVAPAPASSGLAPSTGLLLAGIAGVVVLGAVLLRRHAA